MLKVSFLRRFFHHFLKFLLIPLILSILIFAVTQSSIAAGAALGTFASILMNLNWLYHLEKSYDSDVERVKTGTLTRFLIVIMTCLIWVRFPEVFNIFAIAAGLALSYILIIVRGIKELTK
ncbi:ATP synthase subunit I [Corticicoccus populi]|uniref:ATP synthase subunit I n=1 Tax=Corticicoccus populi TaxID=1812821 RepID=A0ABW5WWJ3_9STAP